MSYNNIPSREATLEDCHPKSKRIYIGEWNELLTANAKSNIRFHVRACLYRGRDLSETLMQIHRNWRFRPQVTFFATKVFNEGLANQ